MLAKNGGTVVVTCRNQERVDETIQKLKAESGSEKILGIVMDQEIYNTK